MWATNENSEFTAVPIYAQATNDKVERVVAKVIKNKDNVYKF